MSPLYLLDTNILVHYVRNGPLWARVEARYGLLMADPRPLISIATEAELRSLALQFQWGRAKTKQMEYALSCFRSVSIDNQTIIKYYAEVDSQLKRRGLALGKNDIWIAATAMITSARLLTTDRDFDPLDPDFLTREWIDPAPGAP